MASDASSAVNSLRPSDDEGARERNAARARWKSLRYRVERVWLDGLVYKRVVKSVNVADVGATRDGAAKSSPVRG